MNAKLLISCAVLGFAGLNAVAAEAHTPDVDANSEARDATILLRASQRAALRPDALIAPGAVGSISLTEQGLTRNNILLSWKF
jgi:hypothetical protein